MKILFLILCSTLLSVSTSVFASNTNIIIDTPKSGAKDPIFNGSIESQNVVVGKDSFFHGTGNLIIGSDSTSDNESIAIGNHVSATGVSIALGAGSRAINNSIAIGNHSYSGDGQVSIGSKYKLRRIENMAAGEKDTDGVNVSQLTPLKNDITANQNKIKTVTTTVATNTTAITTNKGVIATNSAGITINKGDITTNANRIITNTGDINRNVINISNNTTHIRSNTTNVQKNTSEITKTKQLATTNQTNISKNTNGVSNNRNNIQHNSDRIDNVETNNKSYVDNKFNQLKTDIYQVRKRADAGTASAMAMTQIAAPLNGYKYNIGLGSYGEQAATAIGAKFRVNQNMTVGLTSSYDSQHNFGTSAGANWSFN